MKSKERIISDCIKGFYPVLDENGQNIPAYSHDDVLDAMESYATQQTAELQQEVERLKLAIIEIGNHLCEGNYIAAHRYLQSINPQQDENGR